MLIFEIREGKRPECADNMQHMWTNLYLNNNFTEWNVFAAISIFTRGNIYRGRQVALEYSFTMGKAKFSIYPSSEWKIFNTRNFFNNVWFRIHSQFINFSESFVNFACGKYFGSCQLESVCRRLNRKVDELNEVPNYARQKLNGKELSMFNKQRAFRLDEKMVWIWFMQVAYYTCHVLSINLFSS